MGNRLENKVAVITGGGGGIGSAAGKIFCAEGAKVALVDISAEAAEKAAEDIRTQVPGAEIIGIGADLGVETEAERSVALVTEKLGPTTVLVNNVGIRRYEAVADAPWELWDEIVRVNLLSFVSMSRAVIPHMREAKNGSIVNVSSTYAMYGRKGMGAYDATKAGVLALTRTLAFEEAEHNIRVNSICPGFTRTIFHLKRMGEKAVDDLVPPCALKRWAEPAELANPMLWLASEEASYVTSATFMIDGGLPA
ncbi:SDR family oxidoreductase (plasmid) [Rhizobium sp. NIBRBAC000502774]|jgi:NAD(P)-dependent dehydrogenase (short-subunit alcohol dehydrogenase family)|uniref:SDR family NAD(P)-dependent oxidoreductase n=1 Tax=Agrobacterium TaxID=357 RepID=UPI00080FB3D1|nr:MULTISPECIES: SDR family oxidoreductase [Agrobacterium]QDG93870.1 SDR family oxidoreductase [Rhizobium sp. NIBRBAC000502774]NSY46418.1 SDR family oxidoreductase [Agrobacterium tumefaciens]NSZ87359.1 SDR family oxidoreductase [Agrobacterium tumefaciens]UZX45335.1 SDR family oxidoreductase [Agrobacterium sp. 13-2099-1-2]WCA72744.1 SDR family NAD(P)-dependent oxidoreductase [Agrobacterium tumefaciens]